LIPLTKMIEQKYIVVRAKAPKKRKIERFEVKYQGGDTLAELKNFVDKWKLRDIESAMVVPYQVDNSDPEIVFRALFPCGPAERLI